MRELKWYDDKADNSPWIDALAELRQRAVREGYCYQHVQAITVAIDQYAEKALGNRDYFLNKAASAKAHPSERLGEHEAGLDARWKPRRCTLAGHFRSDFSICSFWSPGTVRI
jgi:hypothetical protein